MIKISKYTILILICVTTFSHSLNVIFNNKGKTKVLFSITSTHTKNNITLKPQEIGYKLTIPIKSSKDLITISIQDNLSNPVTIPELGQILGAYERLFINEKSRNFSDLLDKIKLFMVKTHICTIDTSIFSKFRDFKVQGLIINYNSPTFDIELGAIGKQFMITTIKPDITNPLSGVHCIQVLP